MHDLLVFAGGAIFAFLLIIGLSYLDRFDQRRADRHRERPGYIDFTQAAKGGGYTEGHAEGPEHGGGHVTSPPPLRLVKGENDG